MTHTTTMQMLALAAVLTGCRNIEDPSTIDLDGDGIFADVDCNDGDSAVGVGLEEVCDGIDNDCNGVVDEDSAVDATTFYADDDGDGIGGEFTTTACVQPDRHVPLGGDCDDADDEVFPGAAETDCSDPTDYNCDGSTGFADADDDGFAACDDCDDSEAGIHDNAVEVCDGLDNNCSGTIDEAGALGTTTYYADTDGDGHGDADAPVDACHPPTGYVSNHDDCDDTQSTTFPGAPELCDGIDSNCNLLVDDGAIDTTLWTADADGDGVGGSLPGVQACEAPAGHVAETGDCNDGDPAIHPGAAEADCADPTDYNCDGSSSYADADGDGHAACNDCDDSAAAIHANAVEICDGVDNDCNGSTDEAGAFGTTVWYGDADGDGFGDAATTASACAAPAGFVGNDDDCDDALTSVHPGAEELCDGIDSNCNLLADDNATDMGTWYLDADSDGVGGSTSTTACDSPTGFTASTGDCDDTDPAFHPGADESDCADDSDYNCDGSVAFVDVDADGHAACVDCDDTDDTVHPGAEEVCNDIDDDCDAAIDEAGATGEQVWFADTDGDGVAGGGLSTIACTPPPGFSTTDGDCDDTNPDCAYCDYPSAVMADGPVGYWRLNEAGGTVAADSSGNGLDGVVGTNVAFGMPSMVASEPDESAYFYGDGVLLPTQDDLIFDAAKGLTIEAWVLTTNPIEQMVFSQQQCSGDRVQLKTSGTGATFHITESNNTPAIHTSASGGLFVSDGVPHHLVGVRDVKTREVRLYIDGVMWASEPDATRTLGTLTSDPTETWIGRRYPCGGPDPFDGFIDDVAVYDRALTVAEIQAHYFAGRLSECVVPAIPNGTSEANAGQTCNQIREDFPASPDGLYWLDPSSLGIAHEAYCDMTTDGGGWTLFFAYDHRGGQNNPLRFGMPLSPTNSYSHVDLEDMGWSNSDLSELRFYCQTNGHGRHIHFKTDDPQILQGAVSGDQTWGPGDWSSGFTPLSGHTANLPASTTNTYTNPDDGFWNFPFFTWGPYHWGVRGNGGRWECDDAAGNPSRTTLHQVWAR